MALWGISYTYIETAEDYVELEADTEAEAEEAFYHWAKYLEEPEPGMIEKLGD
jgi:hypothetical protein